MTDSTAIFRTYKYRLYPTDAQAAQLDFLLWQGRKIYNGALAMRKERYEETGETISLYDLRDHWCALRKVEPGTLGLLPADSVDALIRRLDKAYKAFFKRLKQGKEKAGFPRFKGRWFFDSLEYRYGAGLKFIPVSEKWAKLRVMNVGHIRTRYHRELPDGAVIKYAVVKRDKKARWWVSLAVQFEAEEPGKHPGGMVGVDVGIKYLIALSDGTCFEHQNWYREQLPELRRLQRKADRQRRANNPGNFNPDGTVKKGVFIWRKSARARQTDAAIAKLSEQVKARREYFWHNITDELTRQCSLIALEDLPLDFMLKNGHLAVSSHDAGLGLFRQLLEYKALRTGTEIVYVPPAYTSQMCSECGEIVKKPLSERTHDCPSCGLVIDRDVNAARNILNLALNGRYSGHVDETEAVGSNVSCKARNLKSVATSDAQANAL